MYNALVGDGAKLSSSNGKGVIEDENLGAPLGPAKQSFIELSSSCFHVVFEAAGWNSDKQH